MTISFRHAWKVIPSLCVLAVRDLRVTNRSRRWQHCKVCFSWKCGDRLCQRNCPGNSTVYYILLQTKCSYLVMEFTVNGKGTIVPVYVMKAYGEEEV